jgi:hypothetical protein
MILLGDCDSIKLAAPVGLLHENRLLENVLSSLQQATVPSVVVANRSV